jgi:hypothetical protein
MEIRRIVVATVLALCAADALALGGAQIVEDWRRQPPGATGLPAGWEELPLLQRMLVKPGALEVVEEAGRRALRMKTESDQHTIIRKRIHVDLQATPVLAWQWKVLSFPTGASLRDRARSDSPAVLAVAWSSPPRVMAYAWDVAGTVGSHFQNPKQSRVNYIVVRSGTEPRAAWVAERRDVADDYRRVFGEAPSHGPDEVELSVDSNDTRSVSEILIGSIAFGPR